MTALLWACDGGNEDIVELLIDADCDHSSRDLDGQTALHYGNVLDVLQLTHVRIRNKRLFSHCFS